MLAGDLADRIAEPLAQSYLSARFEAERYKTQLLPRATRAYQLYLQKYQDMAQAYPQVLVSQRTLFQLQIDYLKALHSAWRRWRKESNPGRVGRFCRQLQLARHGNPSLCSADRRTLSQGPDLPRMHTCSAQEERRTHVQADTRQSPK